MSDRVDIKVAPRQGNAIKEVHGVKRQTLERKRPKAARDQREKGKKKETWAQKFTGFDKGRVRDDEIKGGPGSEEQHSDSGNKTKKKKGSKARGGLVDVII
jgi:SET domain-containing protein